MLAYPSAAAALRHDDVEARENRWGSFIAALEDDCDDDSEDECAMAPGLGSSSLSNNAPGPSGAGGGVGPISYKFSLGKSVFPPNPISTTNNAVSNNHWGAGNGSGGFSSPSYQTSTPQARSRETVLSEWIVFHRGADNLSEERKKYLETSVTVLHSLVSNIISGYYNSHKADSINSSGVDANIDDDEISVHPSFLTIQNIIVKEMTFLRSGADEISTDFVECGDSIFCNDTSDASEKKYLAMDALGKMAYEMFMLGRGPSIFKLTGAGIGTGTSTITTSSVSNALTLDTSHEHHQEQKESDNSDTADTNYEDDMFAMLRKNARTTTSEEKDISGIISTMLDANVPFPLCRFVSDLLLGDEHYMLGRSEHSFSSFADILSDLKQMVDNPLDFIHASSPDRWKLVFGEKLYGRDMDTKAIMDAADRVVTKVHADPLFGSFRDLLLKKKEMVMVSGHSGGGKSRLVRSAAGMLEKKGWRFLKCKFDRVVHPEPLSILANAFDEYFGAFISCPKHGTMSSDDDITGFSSCSCSGSQDNTSQHLQRIIDPAGLGILAKHIPSLHLILKDVKLPSLDNVEVNETMMHALFGKLLHVLSSKNTPILWFIDDLQWADPLSLGLLTALVQQAGSDLLSEQVKPEDELNVMFIGSYRDNEVKEGHHLANVLRKLQSDSSINLTEISLSGFTFETLNKMLSESLCLPIRRVGSLSELVIQKTDGQPLHVIEFIQALTMDNLLTHSFARGWEWDADSIDICPITDSVAELYAFKLRRLPDKILLGLQILSCFGSQIDHHVLGFVVDYDGESSVDITAAIKVALNEGLVEQAAHLVSFAHDMIQKATIDSISSDALVPLLQKLALTLIKNASALGELDSVLFVVVDFINRIGSDAPSSSDQHALFAELNLRAGTKAIAVPDFAGAARFAENGISFLSKSHWETQYEVTLSLYETAILAHFSSLEGDRDQLKKRIDEVFEHAKDFSDKFKTHCVRIQLLSMTDLSKAIEESLIVLERLGEPLDLTNVDYKTVCKELVKHRDQFSGEKKKKFLSSKQLADCNKMRAMKIMSSLVVYFHLKKSYFSAYVSCKMVKMSSDHGHCQDGVFGFGGLASSLVNVLHDVDEGNAWARTTLSLMEMYNKDSLIPVIYGSMYGIVFVWTEPIQSTLAPLAQGIRLSFTTGNVEFAMVNTIFYIARSFNGGKNISTLLGEVQALARQHGNHFGSEDYSDKPVFSPLLQFYLTPLYNTLCGLQGETDTPEEKETQEEAFPLNKLRFTNNDDIMKAALETGHLSSLHNILTYQSCKAFIDRDMDSALKYADMYYENFVTKDLDQLYTGIWLDFYEALITFHFMRHTGNKIYQARGECAILKMKGWLAHSDWNFMNKLLLMEAELHYTKKDFENAALCYGASIKAAKEHKFIHEEAIACELAGIFFFERGLHSESYSLFRQSVRCYDKWGANAVARRVEDTIKYKFDSDLMQLCPLPSFILEEASSKKRGR